jgi:hypothetical protein
MRTLDNIVQSSKDRITRFFLKLLSPNKDAEKLLDLWTENLYEDLWPKHFFYEEANRKNIRRALEEALYTNVNAPSSKIQEALLHVSAPPPTKQDLPVTGEVGFQTCDFNHQCTTGCPPKCRKVYEDR